jgi:integrase
VASIDTGLVLKCIEPHWQTKTETMSRVRGRIENVLDWATVRKYRAGDNPARWAGALEHVLPPRSKVAKPVHFPALPYRELPAFMAALRQREGTAARALEFLILCAARTNEVLGAQWSEIDLANRMWTVPPDRMKAGAQHRVALSQCAVDLLRNLPRENGNNFVFIGARSGGLSAVAMTRLLHRMGYGNISVHGFRSTFRDWCAEQTNFPRELAELALAHRVADKTERAYQRGDLLRKRFLLAEAWSKYANSPPATQAAVVPTLPIAAFRGQGRLSQLSANCGPPRQCSKNCDQVRFGIFSGWIAPAWGWRIYSITWSASAKIDGGMVRPRSVTVLSLITSSNLVGICTGRSPGFAPRRMRSR